jgi:hypothetical protein
VITTKKVYKQYGDGANDAEKLTSMITKIVDEIETTEIS